MKKSYLFSISVLLLLLLIPGCRSSILDDPSTSIDYQIPEKSHVTLTIENNYNTIILTPVDKDLTAGNYEVNFDASHLLAGVYFYTIEARGINSNYYYKSTKKLLLIK
jgi:hypothetical protein